MATFADAGETDGGSPKEEGGRIVVSSEGEEVWSNEGEEGVGLHVIHPVEGTHCVAGGEGVQVAGDGEGGGLGGVAGTNAAEEELCNSLAECREGGGAKAVPAT